jgi:hypothetical protein
MAIKGKKRSKQRSAPRAPRREPVAPPTPFLRRRWVQLTSVFLLGIFAMVVFVWVTNNIREGEADEERADTAETRLAAATAYQQAVRGAFSQVGVVDSGVTPTVFTEFDAALDALADGKPPADAQATFERAIRDARSARRDLAKFNVARSIADQGFDVVEATAFTSSDATLLQALDGFRRAAEVAAAAVAVGGEQGRALAQVAVDLREAAKADLAEGWTEYLQAVRAGGVPEASTTGGELPGGGG